MSTPTQNRLVVIFSLIAGGGDLLTGLALVFVPQWTLARMRVPPATETVFLRFVGIFVACVGASYGFGLLAWWLTGCNRRLRFVWEMTILFRLAAGGFVAAQIAAGSLAWQWFTVPTSDWIWAAAQWAGLRAGYLQGTRR